MPYRLSIGRRDCGGQIGRNCIECNKKKKKLHKLETVSNQEIENERILLQIQYNGHSREN